MTSKANARHTVEKFEEAVRDHSWIGAQPPEDHAQIERTYHRRKAALLRLLGLEYVMPTEDDDD